MIKELRFNRLKFFENIGQDVLCFYIDFRIVLPLYEACDQFLIQMSCQILCLSAVNDQDQYFQTMAKDALVNKFA